jgi:hypothetical protein
MVDKSFIGKMFLHVSHDLATVCLWCKNSKRERQGTSKTVDHDISQPGFFFAFEPEFKRQDLVFLECFTVIVK